MKKFSALLCISFFITSCFGRISYTELLSCPIDSCDLACECPFDMSCQMTCGFGNQCAYIGQFNQANDGCPNETTCIANNKGIGCQPIH